MITKSAFKRWAKRFVPIMNGRLYHPTLQQPVTIGRDKWGIPHIAASNRHDLFVAQGFVHAQDRLWQMELNRRAAQGTLAAVFGAVALDTDRLSRALGFIRLAKASWAGMKQSSQADVEAYTAGVNAFLQSGQPLPVEYHLLRYQPEPWQPLDTIAFARLQMWALTEGASGEIVTAQLIEQLGETAARDLLPHYPAEEPVTLPEGIEMNNLRGTAAFPAFLGKYTADGTGRGSNGWVIAASRSTTGHAILCNDMHLPLGTPSIWHYQHLRSNDGFQVTGFTLPGLPYVMVGHNGRIVWGATLSFVDCEDFFVEKLHPDDPTRYEFEGEWRQAEVFTEKIEVRGRETHVEEVVCTHHGPIIPHFQPSTKANQALALASTALRPNLDMDGFRLLNEARGWPDFVTAVAHLQAPSLNLLYADIDDNIGHWVTGRVPVRQNGDGLSPAPGWTGTHEWVGDIPFNEMPHTLNPQQGYIVSANHRIVGDAYPHYLGQVWRNSYRAQRIEQLIHSQDKISPTDCQQFQQDLYSIPGHELAQQLQSLSLTNEAAKLSWHWLVQWDGWLSAESVGGAIYQVFLTQLAHALLSPHLEPAFLHHYLGIGLHPQMNPVSTFHSYWATTVVRWLKSNESIWLPSSSKREEILEDCLGKVTAVLRKTLGDDPSEWQWGRLHQTHLPHALGVKRPLAALFNPQPFPIGGDGDTVFQTSFLANAPYASNAISVSSRHVVDMGNLATATAILTPGQSGHVGSSHYDDLLLDWQQGRYFAMGWECVEETAVYEQTLTLRPTI